MGGGHLDRERPSAGAAPPLDAPTAGRRRSPARGGARFLRRTHRKPALRVPRRPPRPRSSKGEVPGPPLTASAMLVLGIETSCDETSVAVLDGDGRVRSNVVSSQLAA